MTGWGLGKGKGTLEITALPEVAVGTHFHVQHGTKTSLIFKTIL